MTITPVLSAGSGHANDVVLKRLGAITVIASRIDRLGAEIARHVKVDPQEGWLTPLRDGAFTTPPWATTTSKDVVAWAAATARLLSTRSSLFTAAGSARFTGSRGDTILAESLDGSVFPADEEFLTRYLARLERQLAAGMTVRTGLDYQDEKGQRWPLVSIYDRARHESTGVPEQPLRLPSEWERWLSA
jgi:hypothetical protein